MSTRPSAFLESVIIFLLPYFTIGAADIAEARAEIIQTLAAYATRTRAEMLQAARIIALGMTTLDVLAEAKSTDMSQSMRVRYRGCANGLNRATLQTEKALDQRLACELPAQPEQKPEPANDIQDAEVAGAVQQARALIDAHRNRLPAPTATHPASQVERNKQLWAGAMIDTLKQMGLQATPAPGG